MHHEVYKPEVELLKIDIFSHIMPERYFGQLTKKAHIDSAKMVFISNPALIDLDIRFRAMDQCGDHLLQVLTLVTPPLEVVVDVPTAKELARIANEEMAELVARYPDRFVAAAAALPMNDLDAALEEADYAIRQLKMKGIQICSNINGETLDSPRLRPLFRKMAEYDLPVWIHPWDMPNNPVVASDMPIELKRATWPFETTLAMCRLAASGIFEELPNLKIITHHAGGMVPYYASRIRIAPLKNFYCDTALYGNSDALKCSHDYFGTEHVLFGTDMPLGSTRDGGFGFTKETIEAIERIGLSEADKRLIFEGNARKMLKLSL
jgi:aminocarboxymuconate-semialdehyde decarboxylase